MTFIYKVPAIVPLRDVPHSQWGFVTQLDASFAIRARENERAERTEKRLQSQGRELIKLYGLEKLGSVQNPYSFIKNSLLIRGVNVPGDAADLSLDDYGIEVFGSREEWKELKEMTKIQPMPPFDYVPHNIDTKDQAFCALSLWLNWANTTNVLSRDFSFSKI